MPYDFTPGSGALIRATEGTVLDRIPPRARVRRNAPIELPHVMLLIDDPDKTVIEPLTAAASAMEKLYDFDLMQNGGHITGYKLSDKQIDAVADVSGGPDHRRGYAEEVRRLRRSAPAVRRGRRQPLPGHRQGLLRGAEEGQDARGVPGNLPARYALVEVVNNHDDALQFEPIHRVLLRRGPREVHGCLPAPPIPTPTRARARATPSSSSASGESHFITVPDPKVQLAVGTLQSVPGSPT